MSTGRRQIGHLAKQPGMLAEPNIQCQASALSTMPREEPCEFSLGFSGELSGQEGRGRTDRSCVEKLLLYRVSLAYLITRHLYWAIWKRRTRRISSVLQGQRGR